MLLEQNGHLVDRLHETGFKLPQSQMLLQLSNNPLPLRGRYFCACTPVSDHIDGTFCREQIDQHTIVVLGVPHLEFSKLRHRPFTHDFAHGLLTHQITVGQSGLDAYTNLAAVLRFTGCYLVGQSLQGSLRQPSAYSGCTQMPPQAARQFAHYHSPEAPPPPKLPPLPLEKSEPELLLELFALLELEKSQSLLVVTGV